MAKVTEDQRINFGSVTIINMLQNFINSHSGLLSDGLGRGLVRKTPPTLPSISTYVQRTVHVK